MVVLLLAGILLWMSVRWESCIVHRRSVWFCMAFFVIGGFRMSVELKPYPLETELAHGMGNVTIEGILDRETRKKGICTLVLKEAVIHWEQTVYRLPAILVTVEEPIWEETQTRDLAEPHGGMEPRAVSGMKVKLKGKIELFSTAGNPGEFDYAMYYRGMGLRCKVNARHMEICDKRYIPVMKWADGSQRYLSGVLDILCSEEDLGVYKAVLLGDKTQLDEDIRELYQKNGIAHLLAVSGLHVSLIGMGIYRCLRRLGLGYGTAGFLAGVLIGFYGCLTGFGPSVFRAVLMLLCALLAAYLGRTYDLLSALSLSLFLLILEQPFLLFTGGLQLSFGAVMAIGISKEWMRINAVQAEGLWIALCIQLFTYPIILYHFFEFPTYGILLNILVIPLMAYVVGSGIAAVLLYSLGGAGTFLKFTALGTMGTGHYILAFYSLLCHMASAMPYSSLILGRPKLWKIVVYYALLLCGLFLNSHKKKTGVKKKKIQFLAVSAAASLFLIVHPVRGLSVDFLDVGQGDGIFFQTSQINILVDGGSSQIKNLGKFRLVPFLKSKGISQLDYIFVTHGDLDHISGIEYLLTEDVGISIKHIVFSCLSREDESCDELADLARKRGSTVQYMERGQSIQVGKLSLTAIYPGKNGIASDKNDQSLVLLAGYGDFSMLLTGDVEDGGEQDILHNTDKRILPKRVTVLKAAHHGSASSTGAGFLELVQPEITVLSYGKGNSYGHPSKEVVRRLEKIKTNIWRTAVSGAVHITTDGKKVRVSGFRKISP
ncbi:MAG: DNA internalization-related competence protein ComEC/Rec2 [Clostridium sp.]